MNTEPPKEKIGTLLRAGSVVKLRTLAGGERKIGDWLSDVVGWLFTNRAALAAVDGFDSLIVVPMDEWDARSERLDDLSRRLAEYQALFSVLRDAKSADIHQVNVGADS